MRENKTIATGADVAAYLDSVEPPTRREDARVLESLFRDVTGFAPKMWGPSMIGFGRYRYLYDSGHGGESMATGFAPRKANLVVYILPGYTRFDSLMARLGKHKMGKSCLYINKLADIDLDVLRELIRAGLDDLATRWPVQAD